MRELTGDKAGLMWKAIEAYYISSITAGTIITNLYFFQKLDPKKVHDLLVQSGTSSLIPASIFGSADEWSNDPSLSSVSMVPSVTAVLSQFWNSKGQQTSIPNQFLQLSTYAKARSLYGEGQSSCLERRGAAVALHVNTMYMTVSMFLRCRTKSGLLIRLWCMLPLKPLLMLFANFFAKAYLKKSSPCPRDVKRKEKSLEKRWGAWDMCERGEKEARIMFRGRNEISEGLPLFHLAVRDADSRTA